MLSHGISVPRLPSRRGGHRPVREFPVSPLLAMFACPDLQGLRAIGVLLFLLMFSSIACYELGAFPDDALNVTPNGSCWLEGESFSKVKDSRGNVYAVEPFQIRYLEGWEDFWFCGVLRSSSTPVAVLVTPSPLSEHKKPYETDGFYTPSGNPVGLHRPWGSLSQKYWALQAEWIH